MTSLMDSPFYHQQFIREDTVNRIFAGSVTTTPADTILSLELTEHQSVFLWWSVLEESRGERNEISRR